MRSLCFIAAALAGCSDGSEDQIETSCEVSFGNQAGDVMHMSAWVWCATGAPRLRWRITGPDGFDTATGSVSFSCPVMELDVEVPSPPNRPWTATVGLNDRNSAAGTNCRIVY